MVAHRPERDIQAILRDVNAYEDWGSGHGNLLSSAARPCGCGLRQPTQLFGLSEGMDVTTGLSNGLNRPRVKRFVTSGYVRCSTTTLYLFMTLLSRCKVDRPNPKRLSGVGTEKSLNGLIRDLRDSL